MQVGVVPMSQLLPTCGNVYGLKHPERTVFPSASMIWAFLEAPGGPFIFQEDPRQERSGVRNTGVQGSLAGQMEFPDVQ